MGEVLKIMKKMDLLSKRGLLVIIFLICLKLFFLNNVWAQTEIEDAEKAAITPETATSSDQAPLKEEIVNPHLQLECTICHASTPAPNTNRLDITLIKGVKNSVELCDQCHSNFNLHPVMVDPTLAEPEVVVPKKFPLGLTGETRGKVVCITCHDVHLDGSLNKLLRGLPSKLESGGDFANRLEFCAACHGAALAGRNPHTQSEKTCHYCHLTEPTKMVQVKATVRSDIAKLCLFCHEKITDSHYSKIDPFADEKLQPLLAESKLPMPGGQKTCLTCHDEHSSSKESHFLREEFTLIAEKSRLIDPHDTGGFCLSCHNIDPRTSPQVTYKFDGNFNKVCNWCHSTEKVTADIHPINIVPEKIRVKEDIFPLQDGKITCMTCHDHRCQTKDIKAEAVASNPYFLRGGPYPNRSAVCYQCHPKVVRFDVHDQINDEGEIVIKSCLYCHLTDPTKEEKDLSGQSKAQFTTKMTNLCTRCHQDSPHPANFLHILKPQEVIRQNIVVFQIENSVSVPLDEDGNITCASCHNPHERGVIQNKADTYGADEINRKRLKFICLACHGEASMEDFK